MAKYDRPIKNREYNEFMMESSRWDNFVPREDDIIVCTPAKCGTTWTQMICALLILQKTELDKPLSDYSPWLDMLSAPIDKVLKELNAQNHRRFIKTHTPLDGIPYYETTRYICVGRDPRDAFISLKHHMENLRREAFELLRQNATRDSPPPKPLPEDPRERFRLWIGSSCGAQPDHADVLYHVKSFWDFRHLPNILMVHYSDLQTDLEGEMRRIAKFLEIEVAEHLWPGFLSAASFDNMKSKADKLAPQSTENFWKDNNSFFKKGSSGQWRDILGDKELDLYHQVMAEKLEPNLASWLENGRLASGVH